MTSIKKLITFAVEDSLSSREEAILSAANEAAAEYAQAYDWTDTFVVRSSAPAKKIGDTVLYYFEVHGQGEPVQFNEEPSVPSNREIADDSIAAREAQL